MSFGVNSVFFGGFLGKDPELRYTKSGNSVCNFSVASTRKIRGEDKTEWASCVAWGKTGELIKAHFRKGDPILVSGRLQTSSYEKDGARNSRTEIVVHEVVFLPRGKSPDGSPIQATYGDRRDGDAPSSGEFDDLPF